MALGLQQGISQRYKHQVQHIYTIDTWAGLTCHLEIQMKASLEMYKIKFVKQSNCSQFKH